MTENRRTDSRMLWGFAAALAFGSVFLWVMYFFGPGTWEGSWPAIPLTAGAIALGIWAYMYGRRGEEVQLRR